MELHPHEVRILQVLDRRLSTEDIAKAADLDIDAVNRTISWLSTKGLAEVEEDIIKTVSVGKEGEKYCADGLPERRMIEVLSRGGSFEDFKDSLEKHEIGIGLGWIKKKGMGTICGRENIEVLKTDRTEDEKILELLAEEKTLVYDELTDEQKNAVDMLETRKNVIRITEKKNLWIHPTAQGRELAKTAKVSETISQLTPEMIKNRYWETHSFRKYDIDLYVKPQSPAKKHPLIRLINQISDIFVSMGFKEIKGPILESVFWNFDTLFVPQDHPAREMQDTFYVENPDELDVKDFDLYKEKIKNIHENGGDTGSTGWGYSWDEKSARKTLLRTHTTPVTSRYLTSLGKDDLPAKVFSIGKTFRNEAVDYKHLPEFYQVEGIIVDENVNFRNLLGLLDEFYKKMGFDNVRFRPAYFPYTEMSVEPEIYIEGKGWMELGGAGIFRPEVVEPLLGFDCPVLAWGLGLDRVVALSLGLTDIRELYIPKLSWLRKSKIL